MIRQEKPSILNLRAIGQSYLRSLFWSIYIAISFIAGILGFAYLKGRVYEDLDFALIGGGLMGLALFIVFRFSKSGSPQPIDVPVEKQTKARRKVCFFLVLLHLLILPFSFVVGFGFFAISSLIIFYLLLALFFYDLQDSKRYMLIGLPTVLLMNLIVYESLRNLVFSVTFLVGFGPFALSIITFLWYITKSDLYKTKNASVTVD